MCVWTRVNLIKSSSTQTRLNMPLPESSVTREKTTSMLTPFILRNINQCQPPLILRYYTGYYMYMYICVVCVCVYYSYSICRRDAAGVCVLPLLCVCVSLRNSLPILVRAHQRSIRSCVAHILTPPLLTHTHTHTQGGATACRERAPPRTHTFPSGQSNK